MSDVELRLMALQQDVVGLRVGTEKTKKAVEALTGELHAHTVIIDSMITVMDEEARASLTAKCDERGLTLTKRETKKEGNNDD